MILKSLANMMRSFYAYHTVYTLAVAAIVAVAAYWNEYDNANLSIMDAIFLGVTTSTNTGLITFDFSIVSCCA